MKLNIIILAVLVCFSTMQSRAQYYKRNYNRYDTSMRLKVGDQVPELTFQLMNSDKQATKLSDYKGKLVILDFWNVACGSCIAAMPHMEELQKTFGDKLAILLVNDDDIPERVEKFLSRRKELSGKTLNLPIATNYLQNDKLFTHQQVPYYVWIKNNKVIAFTDPKSATIENATKAINGEDFKVPYYDMLTMNDLTKPFLLKNNINSAVPVSYSILSEAMPGQFALDSSLPSPSSEDLFLASRHYNAKLSELIIRAYHLNSSEEKLILDIENNPVSLNTKLCWEFYSKYPLTFSQIDEVLRNDLDHTFHFQFKQEKRMIDCYQLVKQAPDKSIKIIANPFAGTRSTDGGLIISKRPIQDILSSTLDSKTVVTDLDLSKSKDIITYPKGPRDFKNTQLALNAIGYNLVKTQREMDVTVISDKQEESSK